MSQKIQLLSATEVKKQLNAAQDCGLIISEYEVTSDGMKIIINKHDEEKADPILGKDLRMVK